MALIDMKNKVKKVGVPSPLINNLYDRDGTNVKKENC